MKKKMLSSFLILVSLVFFISCENANNSKTKNTRSKSDKNRAYPNRPERKEKCAPSCGDRCCMNKEEENIQEPISNLTEEQSVISSQELNELKSSVENAETSLNVTNSEN